MTPMYAVVSLLDEKHYRLVEQIWDDLRLRCGVHGIYATPFPHFSYHVAPGYDMKRLETLLRRTARSVEPFRVRTAGLGIFAGPSPVVHIPVVRDPALTRLQQKLWPRIDRMAAHSLAYYHPDQWVPHITLGHGDLGPSNLAGVVEHLGAGTYSWEILIDNLAVISSTGTLDGLHMRFPLGRT